jgi:hypothetical protein
MQRNSSATVPMNQFADSVESFVYPTLSKKGISTEAHGNIHPPTIL